MAQASQIPSDSPLGVHLIEGDVVVLGPGAASACLTPEAAEESARRLMEAARRARRERTSFETDDS